MLAKYIIDNRIEDATIDEVFLMSAFFLIIVNNDDQWFQKILNGTRFIQKLIIRYYYTNFSKYEPNNCCRNVEYRKRHLYYTFL